MMDGFLDALSAGFIEDSKLRPPRISLALPSVPMRGTREMDRLAGKNSCPANLADAGAPVRSARDATRPAYAALFFCIMPPPPPRMSNFSSAGAQVGGREVGQTARFTLGPYMVTHARHRRACSVPVLRSPDTRRALARSFARQSARPCLRRGEIPPRRSASPTLAH